MMPMQPGAGPGGDFWQRIMMQRAAQQGGAAPPQRQSLPGLAAAGSTGGPIARQGLPGLAPTSMGITPQRPAGASPATMARDAETYQGAGQRPMARPTMPQSQAAAAGPGGTERLAMLQNRIAAIRGAGGGM